MIQLLIKLNTTHILLCFDIMQHPNLDFCALYGKKIFGEEIK